MERDRHHDYKVYGIRTNSGLIPGLILVGIGALFFLNNLHIIYIREWLAYWPVILIAIGIVKLVDSTFTGGRVAGGVLFGLGALFLAQSLGFLQIQMHDMWPLILIGLGVLMLFQRAERWHARTVADQPLNRGFKNDTPNNANMVKIDAIFSGGKRRMATQDFQGGEIVTIFGGIELDLRQAGMVADSAVLEVNAIFGGVEVQIPQNWSAVVQGVGIFGGFGDNTLQPNLDAPGVKRLIVKGGAVFGGVEVKN
jgi:predicted membrane protein